MREAEGRVNMSGDRRGLGRVWLSPVVSQVRLDMDREALGPHHTPSRPSCLPSVDKNAGNEAGNIDQAIHGRK